MSAQDAVLSVRLDRFYARHRGDPDFSALMEHIGITDDDAALADLIEADGRLRLRIDRPVELTRYLDAVPDLAQRTDPIDAAIDMTLQLARTGRADDGSIEHLVTAYPALESPIRESAALNNAIWSTTSIKSQLAQYSGKQLPCEFGPEIEDGGRRHALIELLGEGAFGQVYLAVDRQLSEEGHSALVSIKVIPARDRSSWERRRLTDEATKARRINHPHVIRVLDRGVSDHDEDYIVYEYVSGGDLGRHVRRRAGAMAPRETVSLVARIARGVHAAHMAGLVHCDLKPNNVVLTAEHEPKVADFGIAIRAGEGGSARTGDEAREQPLGNLAFMSPEQYRMEPGALTIPSDVYALGGILYWMLTGELPNGASPEEIAATHDPETGRSEPPYPEGGAERIDHDLALICRRALAVRPEDRYGSASRLADDLETWLAREPIAWMRPTAAHRVRLWARRRPLLAAASVLIGLLVMAGVVGVQRYAVTDARKEEVEKSNRNSDAKLGQFVKAASKARSGRLPDELLSQIWLFEWLHGPTMLDLGPRHQELWELRIEVVRGLVDEARQIGREDDFKTLLWESALAFWLVEDDRYREAEPLTAGILIRWETILEPDDGWLLQVRALHACAVLDRLARTVPPDGPDASLRAALRDQLDILVRADGLLDVKEPGTPIHRVVLRHLERLYDPELLDRPELLRQTRMYRLSLTD